jgi:hypothetical protein
LKRLESGKKSEGRKSKENEAVSKTIEGLVKEIEGHLKFFEASRHEACLAPQGEPESLARVLLRDAGTWVAEARSGGPSPYPIAFMGKMIPTA